jgi:transposase
MRVSVRGPEKGGFALPYGVENGVHETMVQCLVLDATQNHFLKWQREMVFEKLRCETALCGLLDGGGFG